MRLTQQKANIKWHRAMGCRWSCKCSHGLFSNIFSIVLAIAGYYLSYNAVSPITKKGWMKHLRLTNGVIQRFRLIHRFHLELILRRNKSTITVMSLILAVKKACAERRLFRLNHWKPMLGAYKKCTEMFWSGVRMLTMLKLVSIWSMSLVRAVCYAVAREEGSCDQRSRSAFFVSSAFRRIATRGVCGIVLSILPNS